MSIVTVTLVNGVMFEVMPDGTFKKINDYRKSK